MRKNSFLMKFLQQNQFLFTWGLVYLVSIASATRHFSYSEAIIFSLSTVLSPFILSVLLKTVIIPRFLHRNLIVYFITVFCASIILAVLSLQLDTFLYNTINPEISETLQNRIDAGGSYTVFNFARHSIMIIVTAFIHTVTQLNSEKKELDQKISTHRMQYELKYLRAQINPHFLFNAMNCIYSLSITHDERTPESVLKLSEMLRYVIDDCRADKVTLNKEIKYIENYIDFQHIRMSDCDKRISFTYDVKNPDFLIPPMIFQPLVENAFKHSQITTEANAFIRIELQQNEDELSFCIENSCPKTTGTQQNTERTGIGISNVKQRLKLLFNHQYTFETAHNNNTYKISLRLNKKDLSV